jgi:WhiB family redox-sensing transcriptional regulator
MSEEIKAPYFDGTQICAQIGGDIFFPESPAEVSASKRYLEPICGECEFKVLCLEYALTHNVDGIWAGTTVRQRQDMRTKLKIRIKEFDYSRARN